MEEPIPKVNNPGSFRIFLHSIIPSNVGFPGQPNAHRTSGTSLANASFCLNYSHDLVIRNEADSRHRRPDLEGRLSLPALLGAGRLASGGRRRTAVVAQGRRHRPGFTQILLTYTLGAITGLLGIATLWLACGTLARDVEDASANGHGRSPAGKSGSASGSAFWRWTGCSGHFARPFFP